MRIGMVLGTSGPGETLEDLIESARKAEAAGLDNLWMANIFSYDAISSLAVIGREVPRIGLGTAVTPTYPRHPTAIAQQALTTAAATKGRFSLGIGLSHKLVIQDMLGMSYDKPAKHMREYLSVLMPLVRGKAADFDGEQYNVHGFQLDVPGSDGMPVIVAALGPVMLKLAREMADGTITWMVGHKTLAGHIVPSIGEDRTVVAGVPIVLTNNVDDAKKKIDEQLAIYGQLPSYRAMLDREGASTPSDIALVGDENALRSGIERYRDAGVTDFNAAITATEDGAFDRTLDFFRH
ncbi:MAG: TIGR03564 family F420-dependent LLM class oxidoreductase [Gammaproteobacteria bacterium]|nr:TIGR03564 family F420-dependent LLM class oxidoreductase [Gammaproteobacteria bacterium]